MKVGFGIKNLGYRFISCIGGAADVVSFFYSFNSPMRTAMKITSGVCHLAASSLASNKEKDSALKKGPDQFVLPSYSKKEIEADSNRSKLSLFGFMGNAWELFDIMQGDTPKWLQAVDRGLDVCSTSVHLTNIWYGLNKPEKTQAEKIKELQP